VESYLQAFLASFDGRDIASDTTSDDDQIPLLYAILAMTPSTSYIEV
jgi:hypothetical protein